MGDSSSQNDFDVQSLNSDCCSDENDSILAEQKPRDLSVRAFRDSGMQKESEQSKKRKKEIKEKENELLNQESEPPEAISSDNETDPKPKEQKVEPSNVIIKFINQNTESVLLAPPIIKYIQECLDPTLEQMWEILEQERKRRAKEKQKEIDALQKEIEDRTKEITALQKQIEAKIKENENKTKSLENLKHSKILSK